METIDPKLAGIEALKQAIENKLGWGSSSQWTHQAFEDLSEQIWEETRIKLSATTLKRLWGKVDYQSQPTANTLNALAKFVGYQHWLDYVGQQATKPVISPEMAIDSTSSPSMGSQKRKGFTWSKRKAALVVSLSLLLLLLVTFNQWISHSQTVDPSQITFSSEPVTQGLPNTVVFHYDVSTVKYTDIAIQQSWDESLRASVAPDRDTYTATYYFPGYYRAKLLVNNREIKEHDLYIRSNGWLTIAEANPVPFYLSSDSSLGHLQVSTPLLKEKELLTREEVPWINYYYVDDFGALSANNFTLETRIKNEYNQGKAICQLSEVKIICSNGHFTIPLSIPGCVGQLYMDLGKTSISGTTHNLSALGCDLSTWQTLRMEVGDGEATLYLNNKNVFSSEIGADVGKVVGLRYRFHGPGAVDYVQLYDGKGKLAFKQDFNTQ